MEVSGQLHAPAALSPKKRAPGTHISLGAFAASELDVVFSGYQPLDRRLGGLQSRSGCDGVEENSQPLPGLEPPIIQPVAQRYTSYH
jgi:hypothetical protein